MNHCFRLIYNRISNRWVVASELARRQGKATSGSRTVRRALVVAGVGLAGILGAGEVAAACKSPLQWTEQGLLIPGIANMSRTPDAGFSIKIDNSNRSAPNGRDAENMGPLWLDHYCERSPAVPANQNLTVYARGMNGGVGNSGGFATSGGAGGRGGDGSNIFVGLLSDDGLISVNGVAALLAHSRGGNGGDGGSAGAIAGSGGRGGLGGNGGAISLLNAGTLRTTGNDATAMYALSEGGFGGRGADGSWWPWSSAGSGGTGGNSGSLVTGVNLGTISTTGAGSDGVHALSVGGNGGNGGVRKLAAGLAIGGDGGGGGAGGKVILQNVGAITTQGGQADALSAKSIGGGGGDGGWASGGNLFVNFTMGGEGNSGGTGGLVNVTNSGSLSTSGSDAIGIRAQSIGGGGGSGGRAISGTLGPNFSASAAVGGRGGDGGNADTVRVTQNKGANIVTGAALKNTYINASELAALDALNPALLGERSYGIFAQSLGGGGGSGGSAISTSIAAGSSASLSTSFTLGGAGGNGGNGGGVAVENLDASISTYGNFAQAIVAQSIGGGGGAGGETLNINGAASSSVSGSLALNLGGRGGNGGNGSLVEVQTGSGSLMTVGMQADAVLAQSIGGGGGNGGSVLNLGAAVGSSAYSLGVNLGGSGGRGGSGGTVTVNTSSTGAWATTHITTLGDRAAGIKAQSIGGGGGNGGTVKNYALALQKGEGSAGTASVNLGGSGGSGGVGGTVTVNYNGIMDTHGAHAAGIFAQSIGGGGGSGGNVFALSVAGSLNKNEAGSNQGRALNTTVNLGGSGGSGNHGGVVNVKLENSTKITTTGVRSPGLLAQSIGGGGGHGGDSHSYSITSSLPSTLSMRDALFAEKLASAQAWLQNQARQKGPSGQSSFNFNANLGGKGGAAGNGNTISLTSSGTIHTVGNQSYGVFAQSVGGGGGSGGSALTTGAEGVGAYTLGLSLGGSGGGGGNGGTVGLALKNDSITTEGGGSYGVLAQSVGGGGGEGGLAGVGFDNYTYMSGSSVNFAMGGKGGTAGNGGVVTSFGTGSVTTKGFNANGIVAQSIGGGGGVAGNVGLNSGTVGLTLSGSGGGGGSGNTVFVGATKVNTSGYNAVGILAQSIGGGGGLATVVNGNDALAKLRLTTGATGGTGGNGGSINVGCAGNFAQENCGSTISTSGVVAHGIVAQSIGGGGGFVQHSHGSPGPLFSPPIELDLLLQGSWRDNIDSKSGRVAVLDRAGSRFNISTTGNGAIGIVAQSLNAGGGVLNFAHNSSGYKFNAKHSVQNSGTATDRNGGVDVTLNGSISTKGMAAHGIYAQALAATQTVFAADNALVYGGGGIVANGRINITTASTSNISTAGEKAHGIVTLGNSVVGTPAQRLSLAGQISVSGRNSWAVRAQNGFVGTYRQGNRDAAAVQIDVSGALKGTSQVGGLVAMENYNGGVNVLNVHKGAQLTISRTNAATDCASGCAIVDMMSNLNNQFRIEEGGTVSGGTVLMKLTDKAAGTTLTDSGNFVAVLGTLRSVPSPDGSGQLNVYQVPALQLSAGRAQIDIAPKGQVFGSIDATNALGGAVNNWGKLTGSLSGPKLSYHNYGQHVVQISGKGDGAPSISSATYNDHGQGQVLVELTSLPSGFKAQDIISAGAKPAVRANGVRASGASTTLNIQQSGNKVTVTGASVNYGGGGLRAALPPTLQIAADIANAQANSGVLPEIPEGSNEVSELYDYLLDLANEPEIDRVTAALDNFALGYSDAEMALAAAWYAANQMQSCGDRDLGKTSAVEQGSCAWTRLIYDDMSLGDGQQKGHSWGFNAGWQQQYSDKLYVGLSGGITRTEYAHLDLAHSVGNRVAFGGILKYVDGNLFGSASLVGGYGWDDGERWIDAPGAEAIAKSDREHWLFSTRLRGGYDFAFDSGFSVTPALELNVPVVRDRGYRERGAGEFNMQVHSSTNVVPDLYSSVQLNQSFALGKATARGWVEVGRRVRFGDLEVDVRLPDGFTPDTVTHVAYDPGTGSTRWATGLLLEWNERLEARFVYENERGSRFASQTGSVKFAWKL